MLFAHPHKPPIQESELPEAQQQLVVFSTQTSVGKHAYSGKHSHNALVELKMGALTLPSQGVAFTTMFLNKSTETLGLFVAVPEVACEDVAETVACACSGTKRVVEPTEGTEKVLCVCWVPFGGTATLPKPSTAKKQEKKTKKKRTKTSEPKN
jgi:hypothetical protein